MSNIYAKNDRVYPAVFADLADPPTHIYARGNTALLQQRPCIAVIGSRKMTPYGRAVIETFVPPLSRAGVVIVSGLALGCDGYAHEIALKEKGNCIAVLPGSLDRIYPKSHTPLADAIGASGGLLISEHADGAPPPMQHHFLERNRLIAALADAVFIVEAAARSGALATARFALDLGRDIATVPGNITNPGARGTNHLLQRGAHVVLEPQDLADLLDIRFDAHGASAPRGATPAEQDVLDLLVQEPRSVDQLAAISTMDTSALLATLSQLEVRGIIARTPDMCFTISATHS